LAEWAVTRCVWPPPIRTATEKINKDGGEKNHDKRGTGGGGGSKGDRLMT